MKTALAALFLALLTGSAVAQQAPASLITVRDKTQSTPRLNAVEMRADRLSSQMVRDLHLNNYQSTRLRAINENKIAKMAEIERKNAGNQKLIDEQCNGVCKERDKEFQAFLSTDQYSTYFGSRAAYNRFDKDYAMQSSSILLTESVQNPNPVRANDASVAPTTTKPSRPAGNLGRNAR